MLQKALVLVFVFACIAGSIGCSTSSHFIYATIPAASELAVYREDPFSGTLTELAGTPYTVGDGAQSVVIHPSGKFLYVANPGQGENDISLFDIASNGYLTEVPPRTTVAINGNGQPGGGAQPTLLVMDPAGHYLYVMNTASDNISAFSIDSSTGVLTQLPTSPFSVGGLTPLNMQLTPNGNFLYVSVAGGQADSLNGSIFAFSVNAGALQLLTHPFINADGQNPYGLAIDPSGSYLYVANTQSQSISVFTILPSGTLEDNVQGSPLSVSPYNTPQALLLDPKGQFLYVANQGSSNVAVYSIDSSTGLPTALTTSTSAFAFTTEGSPSFLVEDPNGRYLFVGNQGQGAGIQAFGVNSGNLNPLITYNVGNTPSSIAITQ